jgi:hypothetical protein
MEVLAQMINLALPKPNGPKACRIWGYTKMVYFSNITNNICARTTDVKYLGLF